MKEFQERVIKERADLREKLTKLQSYADGQDFQALPFDERQRIDSQQDAMQAYLDILDDRIKAFVNVSVQQALEFLRNGTLMSKYWAAISVTKDLAIEKNQNLRHILACQCDDARNALFIEICEWAISKGAKLTV